MAGSTGSNSDLTSTSHTLTNLPAMSQNGVALGPNSAVALFLDSTTPANRHVFLQPPPLLPNGSLQLAKETLDSLAGPVSDQQQQRLREAGKKRKRDGTYGQSAILKIRKLHIDGFETDQVWQQAKKIISSALQESTSVLEELEENNEIEQEGGDAKTLEFGKDGFEVGSDDEDDASASSEVDEGSEADSEDSEEETSSLGEEGESMFDLEASSDEEGEEDDEEEDDEDAEVGEEGEGDEDEDDYDDAADDLIEDPNGLNDGFFSIDEFNKQTQWFEDQDARADPNTDLASDDEAVDWHGDPFTAKSGKKGAKDEDSDVEMDDDDDDDGPALTKKELADLAKFSDDEDDEDDDGQIGGADDMDMDLTANDVYYKDFFAPPAKKKKTGNQRKPYKPKQSFQPTEEDMERAENDVKRDLFDDISEFSDEEDALSDASAGNPKSRRSAHERRQAKIAEEIRKLESELVAKRAWTLSGEATAQARPINSLLEEDLDFEHAGKPVPVMMEEVSESIEELIKRRILANEFDEVLRRRPDDFGNPNRARRGLVDIEDTKGKQSLAEIYEEQHVKDSNPDAYVSQADEKTRKDEEEIKQMWKDISARLDALSSWHYKPKPVAPTLTVVADVATVAMEDAQPTTAQGVAGGESMIAPQEVYAPGKDSAEKGEVVAKSGLPVAKQEMSREEKARRRRRDKERIRKAGGLDAGKPVNKKAQAQQETMKDLKKGGVKVINKKGEVVGLDGKKIVEHKGPHTSGAFKL
ncbi:Mpp10 protein-domain-containing protein [Triangularia verruculosa]|uniref:U3 small nucleolar ribonucleoprotein protein MPP10 n=1 Tax=Triangularia verruculosa TaxID=2587418 RepID=A0AAN6X8Q0_9PEZI|nr:Mpp10 protein-domain-containing protein [Triangularia verruculosa]